MENFEYTLVGCYQRGGGLRFREKSYARHKFGIYNKRKGKDIPRNTPDDDLTRTEEGVRVASNSQGLITSTKQSQRIPSMHQKPAIVICFSTRKSNVDKSSPHSNLLDVLLTDVAVGRVFGVGSA